MCASTAIHKTNKSPGFTLQQVVQFMLELCVSFVHLIFFKNPELQQKTEECDTRDETCSYNWKMSESQPEYKNISSHQSVLQQIPSAPFFSFQKQLNFH
jgi:hypothetical protein